GELDRFVQVARLYEDEAAELLLRLDEGAIGGGDLAVPDAQARGRANGLQGVGGDEMAAAPELLVVRQRLRVQRFVLAPGPGFDRRLVDPDRTQVLHRASSFLWCELAVDTRWSFEPRTFRRGAAHAG